MRLAVAGLGLLAFSLAFVTEASVFPGWLSLPPTMGTALLILAGRSADNPISGGLACRPLVWVGLVSYSAYLWHWPLLAFYRYGHTQIGPAAALSLFLLTFAPRKPLAMASGVDQGPHQFHPGRQQIARE